MKISISANQWRTVFAVAAAIVAFLLTQQNLPLSPIVQVALGAVSVGLAVLEPSKLVQASAQ